MIIEISLLFRAPRPLEHQEIPDDFGFNRSRDRRRSCEVKPQSTWTSKMPKVVAQDSKTREYRQCRVHYFRALVPILSVVECWAILLGISEVQVHLSRSLVPVAGAEDAWYQVPTP